MNTALIIRFIRHPMLLPFHASHMFLGACHRGQFCLQQDLSLIEQYFPEIESGFLVMQVHRLLCPTHYLKGQK